VRASIELHKFADGTAPLASATMLPVPSLKMRDAIGA
jgi:hypothetical protein